MATTTINTTKDASAITPGTYSWNGKDNHHPVGVFSDGSYTARSFVYFPISFTGWTAVTSATMYVRAHHPGSGIHCYQSSSSTLDVYRMTSDWGEDVGSENVWTTDSHGYSWSSRAGAYTTSNGASASFLESDGTWYSVNITGIVQDWFAGSANYGVILKNSNESSHVYGMEFYTREGGYAPYVVINYSTNTAPNAPISLAPTGGAVINSLAPTFTGTSSDPDAGDSMGGYQIQVYNNAETTLIWDSGTIAAAGATTFSKTYSGAALTGNTFYTWRARTYDKAGAWGPYSAFQQFKVNSPPSAPTVSISGTASDETTLTPVLYVTHHDPDPSDGSMHGYRVLVYRTSDGAVMWDTGNTSVTPTTTLSLTYAGPGLAWQTAYHFYAYTEDSNGAWGPWSSSFSFTTHSTGVPVSLSPSGGGASSGLAPTLAGSRGSSADTLTSANVQVYDSTGTTLIWDSGTFTAGVTSTAFSKAYGGSTLAYATTYTWRARVTGSIGGTSAWSALQTFVTPASGSPVQTAPVGSPITTLTPSVQFSRTASYNAYQLVFYEANGSTVHWSSGTVGVTSTTSTTITYAGTALLWNSTYQWKVQLSSDGGSTWGSGWSGLVSFATDSAGLPTLTAPADGAWLTTLTPTFTGTTYSAESAVDYRILVYAADQTTLVWDSGDVAQTAATSFSAVYGGVTALTYGATYYWQARYTKSTGPVGNYAALQSFHINAIPSMPGTLLPATGAIIQDSLLPTFTSTFVDADITNWGDTPSKLEIEVYRQSDNVLFGAFNTTTGLIAGSNDLAYPSVGVTALVYETVYMWHARYTDSQGAAGPWCSYQTFKPSQSSSITITAPGATITSPKVTATWTFSSPGSKSQQQYRLTITDNATLVTVYDSGWVTATAGTHTVPAGYLINGETYAFAIDALDTDGI